MSEGNQKPPPMICAGSSSVAFPLSLASASTGEKEYPFFTISRVFLAAKRRNLEYKSCGFHAVQIIPEYVNSLFNGFFKEFMKRAACIDFWEALSQYAVR
jgi:hypothetical protein